MVVGSRSGLTYCHSHVRARGPGLYGLCMLPRGHSQSENELQTSVANWALCTPCVQGSR